MLVVFSLRIDVAAEEETEIPTIKQETNIHFVSLRLIKLTPSYPKLFRGHGLDPIGIVELRVTPKHLQCRTPFRVPVAGIGGCKVFSGAIVTIG